MHSSQDKNRYVFEVIFNGQVDSHWIDYINVNHFELSTRYTRITGWLEDQSALYGIIRKIRSSGHQLLKFNCELVRGISPIGIKNEK